MKYTELANRVKNEIITDRRYIHEHAECGLVLPNTVGYVKKRLASMGYEPVKCGNGIIACVGSGSPVILLRADMDALQVKEENDLSFRSHSNISHMCGHDLHTAMLLGVARLLKENEHELKGTVKLMFQPGEELGIGAKNMIAAGVLDNPKVNAALSMHVITNINSGTLSYKPGVAFSSMDFFKIEIEGKGGHGSAMEYTVDPIHAAVEIYQAIDSVVAREVSMFSSATCSIGCIQAGQAGNVIPQYAKLEGSLRCYNEDDRTRILKRIENILKGVSISAGVETKLNMESAPMLKNDEKLCQDMKPYFKEFDGLKFKEDKLPATGSEDFAYIAERVPTMYLLMGVGEPGMPTNHNPKAFFDEEYMHIGSAAFANAATRWLAEENTRRRKTDDFK